MIKLISSFGVLALILVSCVSQKVYAPTPISITHIDDPIINVHVDIKEAKAAEINKVVWPCPDDMVEVNGNACQAVEQACINLDTSVHNANGYVKCDEYAPSKCFSDRRIHMHYCIDRFEYPNKRGSVPYVMASWNDMAANCATEGKRLCKDTEWTFACEGEDMLPYPYGLKRDANICNIDHIQRPDFDASKDNMTSEMVSYLDQRVPSGSMPQCVSPFGVHDMTGNVDESVINSSGHPYRSAEMGGHWVLGARNRCRPKTVVHNESFKYYEIGGRCCKDTQ